MGVIWQRRALLREPQQGAGLGITQIVFTFTVKLIKAPLWTGGLLLPCTLQDVKVVVAAKVVEPDQGQLFSWAHCSTARWPPSAALAQVFSSQLQPLCRAHCRIARWPVLAALAQVSSFHRQPLWRAHCSTARWPPPAAQAQVSSLQLQPFYRAHCRTTRWPPPAAHEHVLE